MQQLFDQQEASIIIRIQEQVDSQVNQFKLLKDQEISRLTINYETLLDQLKQKLKANRILTQSNTPELNQLQLLQDQLDDELQAHQATKLLIQDINQSHNDHINQLNHKFYSVLNQLRANNQELELQLNKLKQTNQLLQTQLNELN